MTSQHQQARVKDVLTSFGLPITGEDWKFEDLYRKLMDSIDKRGGARFKAEEVEGPKVYETFTAYLQDHCQHRETVAIQNRDLSISYRCTACLHVEKE